MAITLAQALLAALSGGLVSLTLGLVGGGGSILAVPLILYVVGIADPHVAIGTSAVAVAANAATGLVSHARAGTVRWRAGLVFAGGGVGGAALGSALGKAVEGQRLLLLFALLMFAVGVAMLRRRGDGGAPGADCTHANAGRVLGLGAGTGLVSGFFGIGGGFLIVPGLRFATDMAMLNAVGTSLVAVTAFAATAALSHAASDLIAWPVAAWFVLGGTAGGAIGSRLARRLAHRARLTPLFATLIFVVAGYMLWEGTLRLAAPAQSAGRAPRAMASTPAATRAWRNW